jgi:amino acid adenylation domain-containing protein
MWFDEQLAPDAPMHRLVLRMLLRGPLETERMRSAWAAVASRFDSLKLQIDARELQQTLSCPDFTLPLVSVSNEDDAQAWVIKQARSPWPADRRWTVALLSWAPDAHLFSFCCSHLLADGRSLYVLIEEFARCYRGEPPVTAPSFTEYLEHEAKYLASAKAQTDTAFWTSQLSNPPPPPSYYEPSTAAQGLDVVRCQKEGGSELAQRLAQLAQTEPFLSLTPEFSRLLVMATGLCACLNRISGQSQILLAIPLANRPPRFARTFGLLMTQLFLRVEIEPGDTLIRLVGKLRRAAYSGLPHSTHAVREGDLSYVTLNLLPNLPQDFAGIDVSYSLDSSFSIPGPPIEGPGSQRSHLGLQFADFLQDPLRISFDFHAATFGDSSRERFTRHFFRTLDELTRRPDARLDDLDLLDEAEREQVLVEWNRTEKAFPREVPLARLVEEQVARTPDAVAVVFGDESLTFAELNARANQLARRLVEAGAGPDRVVGLYVERSVNMVVALLAIVKSGAAYLPLDPLLPEERINTMLEDSGTTLVVTETDLEEMLPSGLGTVVLLDSNDWKSGSRENLVVAVEPDHLAYLLYTSGSTGKPKGVAVPRGALTNLLWCMRDWLGLTASDRLLAVTTISFDIAGLDMWGPLLVGACMVIASREEAMDGESLQGLLDRHDITFLQATPITWRLLSEAGWKGSSRLQSVCTGEAMPRDLAATLAPMVGRLWNLYGPTETTIWSTGYLVRDGKQPILIGRPVANTQCYILDENRRPVPIGVVGELYIGGDGLARGYHGRPELTEERFLPDPFSTRPGARMYRTGDLARYLADGNLECLGRTDHQVKVRGHRIELGEIEAALMDDDHIQKGVVAVRTDALGDARLVAYVVFQSGKMRTGSEMRRRLAGRLPEYMLPHLFVELNALPLTASGKVDRRALPEPFANEVLPGEEVVEPRTPMEKGLAALWSELLKRDKISIRDNFFALGGNSLLATQMVAQLFKRTGYRVGLRSVLFETLEQLAESFQAQA